MVEHPHIDQSEGTDKPRRDDLVGRARACHTGKMIVPKDDRGSVEPQSVFDDLAWIDVRGINYSSKED